MKQHGRYTDAEKADMVSRYLAGETQRAIAARYGCTSGNVRSILVRRKVELRPQGFVPSDAEDARILELRAQRRTIQQVADELGISKHWALTRSRALGVADKKVPRGPRNNLWKSGRSYKHGTGYMYVTVPLEDPLRVMCGKNGHLPEHRLVMARSLGRPLTSQETVHHINGDKTDNRIENLQLRSGQHGKGVQYKCLDCGSHNVRPSPL